MALLRALLGLLFFVAVAWVLSSHRRHISVRTIIWGIILQIGLAGVILKTDTGRDVLDTVSSGVTHFLDYGRQGASMVFGQLTGFINDPAVTEGDPTKPVEVYSSFPAHLDPEVRQGVGILFAFRALPTIIYFSAVMAILYYLGIMQAVIWVMAKVMTWLMRVSGAESLAMAANVFVGQTEAPLVIRPYIGRMTRSELMAMMTGGFATIAGSVLAVYIGFLGSEFAGHLLAASFMSAPAAFVMAKIMIPETEEPATGRHVQLKVEREASNVLDAAATGTSDGLKLYLNVLAMLIAFVAILGVINWMLGAIVIDGDPLTLQRVFGWVFAPVAWLMGVEWNDCQSFGTLLGTKIGVNEFVAFAELGQMKNAAQMSPRSLKMAAYALCGFANFASIGIQIGGISPLAPERRPELSKLAFRAMLGGAFASWMTATIAGALIDE